MPRRSTILPGASVEEEQNRRDPESTVVIVVAAMLPLPPFMPFMAFAFQMPLIFAPVIVAIFRAPIFSMLRTVMVIIPIFVCEGQGIECSK